MICAIFACSKKTGVRLIPQLARYIFATLICVFALLEVTSAQQVFDRRITTVNGMGLAVTNTGTIGKPDVRNNPGGDPSMEYPRDTGTEHLFEAGIWIAGIRDGSILLSSSSVTNPSGYSTGTPGFEFTNDGRRIEERSSLPESELFSPFSISHQDFLLQFSDRRTAVITGTGSIPIRGHDQPMLIDVNMEVYSWNFGFTEAFSIIRYDLENTSSFTYDSVWVGLYGDIVVRNVNTTLEGGGAFFNKNGIGYLDSLYTTYAFDAGSADDPKVNTYGGMSIIGSDYRDEYFHPSNPDTASLIAEGLPVPVINPNYWLFSAGSGLFVAPANDQERYLRMTEPLPLDEPTLAGTDAPDFTNRELLRTAGRTANGNFISLISLGPFPEWSPGETITVYTAWVAGLMPEAFQGLSGTNLDDTPQSRRIFEENIDWVYRTFRGEDTNNNGKLDAGEDVNENGMLDRFLIPEPPSVPNMRVELDQGRAIIYWDNSAEFSVDPVSGEQDFEGYRVYRSELGDDLAGTISQNANLIQQWDLPGNAAGFNNGLDDIRLETPYSAPDGNVYHYSYEVTGLLSGWQYLFAVTAFDGGSTTIDLPELETSVGANAVRVFPGTAVNDNFGSDSKEYKVGVYPNPYRVNAAWDGGTSFTRKVMFYNLPQRAQIRVYTLAGDIVAELDHDAATYQGDTRWFDDLSVANEPGQPQRRIVAGGEHAWDLLTDSRQNLTTGLYLYTVKDMDSGDVQRGKLAIIK